MHVNIKYAFEYVKQYAFEYSNINMHVDQYIVCR